jgi:multiple sugar transport system substrate-binding protein
MDREQLTRRSLLKQALTTTVGGGVVAELLSGCATTPPVSTPAPCDVKLRPAKTVSSPVTISWSSEERIDSIYTELIDLFQRLPDNNAITIQHVNSQSHDQLLNELLHCQGPDVLSLDVVWIDEFVDKKLLLPLCNRWSVEERAQYFPIPMEAATVDGVVYAAPFRTDLGLLYYRTDVVHNAPQTWDELTAAAQQAIDHRQTRYGYIWQGGTGTKSGRSFGEALVCNFIEVLYGYGGSFDLHDLTSITQDEAVLALSEMAKWVGTISPWTPTTNVTTFDEDDSSNIWSRGDTAFMRNWPYEYAISNKRGTGVAGKFGVASLPYGGKEKEHVGHSCLGGWYLAINAQISADKQDAAWQFIHWMMQEEAQKVAAKRNSLLVTLQSVYDKTSQDYSDLSDAYPFFDLVPDLLKQARLRPRSPHYYSVSNIIQSHIHQALIHQEAPRQALQNLRKALQGYKTKETKFICGV